MNPNDDIFEKRSKKNRNRIVRSKVNKLFSNLDFKENVKLLNTIVESKRRHIQ